ncbi:MAG: LuxR C-terminal-related transcriptional regulator [Bacteroidales bacterium]|jgi:DNA-binding CsgD family transcriptional regulator|nr:LuxR C-terminal-related transcriptional regulator [Bacteroidales bacterium]
MKNPICIAVVEPSGLLREGLSKVISDSTTMFYPLLKFETLDHFFGHRWDEKPFIIVINPYLLTGDSPFRRKLKDFNIDAKLVGFITTCVPQSFLLEFDSLLNMYMTNSQIIKVLRDVSDFEKDVNREVLSDQYDLSEREVEVLVLVAKGKTNKEIAQVFNISVHTVMSHRKNIAKKTGIKSISGLTVYAMLNGLMEK